MRSTQLLTVLALLATSVSSMSIGLLPQDMPHRRHASAEVHKSVLQARGARQFNPEHMGLSGRANPAPRRVRKRGVNQRRCAARSSTTSLAPASTEPAAPTSSPEPEPTTSAEPTPSPEPTTTKTKTKAATKTSTTAEPEPTTDNGGSGSGSGSGGSNTGEGTFYDPALGACGITNTNADKICAVSHLLFDGFEGYTGSDPNSNPICGRKIRATYKGKSVVVTVTDRCVGCQLNDLDFSRGAFDQLADQSLGRLTGVTWSFI